MDIFYPFQAFADLVTFSLLGLANGSYLGSAVNFFVYDVLKIGLLLIIIGFVMAIMRYYFPVEKVKNILSKRRWYGLDYLLAALLGVVTPFCSCSSIPLFIGFTGAGIPLGVTFAFLISSPLVNEASLYFFPALFGLKITILYNVLGISIAMMGGMVIQRLKMDKYIKRELLKFKSRADIEKENGDSLTFKEKASYWWHDGWNITKEIFPYVLIGVGIGALIHGYVPNSFIETYLSSRAWWVIPVVSVIGAPLYANSVSILPIMEALVNKGVPLGTVLAFMTSTVALSLPGLLILRKVMRWQLLIAFVIITLIGIIIMGYFFNWLF